MEHTLFTLFFTCLVLATVLPIATATTEVPVLDGTNFEQYMQTTPLALVMFYAPWCGHCKQFEPEFASAADTLKDLVPLVKVDGSSDLNAKLTEQYEISGFPTIKLYREGKVSHYGGERTADAIVAYMKKRTGPPCTELHSKADVDAFKNEHDVVVVGFFSDPEGANFKVFEGASRQADDVPFGNVMDVGVRDGVGGSEDGVVMHKKFDEPDLAFTGGLNADELISFVHLNSLPKVIQFSEKTAPVIFASPVKTHLVAFFDNEKNGELNAEVVQAAGSWRGEMLFIHIVPSEAQIMDYFGVKQEELPALRIVDLRKDPMKKYEFSGSEITGEKINEFVLGFVDGKLEPKLRSEDTPEAQTEDVRVVVTNTFTADVIENDKDVLVEFYAPWCSHCKELKPHYDALALKLKHVETVVIAKVNAEANELPQIKIEGFPTIKLWPAGKKDAPVDYQGERNEQGLVDFVKQHATHKWFDDKRDEL